MEMWSYGLLVAFCLECQGLLWCTGWLDGFARLYSTLYPLITLHCYVGLGHFLSFADVHRPATASLSQP